MHEIQKILLKRLMDRNGRRYAFLTKGYSYEENVVFHLKQLVGQGLLEKKDGLYMITAKGVKAITKFDLGKLEETGFKTFFAGFLCKYEDKYLIKSHPQGEVNFYNLPSVKPNFGERMDRALVRGLKSYLGLSVEASVFKFLSLHLKTVKTSAGEVLFDDAFAIYEVKLNADQFENAIFKNEVFWADSDEIKKLENRWPELDWCILEKSRDSFMVYDFVSDYILGGRD